MPFPFIVKMKEIILSCNVREIFGELADSTMVKSFIFMKVLRYRNYAINYLWDVRIVLVNFVQHLAQIT